jgi:RimJ/RimL family protein N-acetyltransferase
MQPRLLTTNDYFKHFYFQEYGTGCGIETESQTGENYFWVQIFLPVDFFDLDKVERINFDPFLRNQISNIPDLIQVKFELFGIGSVGEVEAFVFKPWVVNIDNPILFQFFEDFHLFIPSVMFYNLIARLLFFEQLNQSDFDYIRILQDIPSTTFQRYGIDSLGVPRTIYSEKLVIEKMDEVDQVEISKFYADNWENITPALESKYFRPLLNTWFRIKLEEPESDFFGLRQKSKISTIGFLRLYNKNSSFTGGTSIEYIVEKAHRNKGYATQASLALINFMKAYSYAFSIGAEVKDDNEFSKRVLNTLGFSEVNQGHFSDDNFYLSLIESLKVIEEMFNKGELEVSILNQYISKYNRYFI